MATISSLGVGSGLDLSSIVSGLVDAERAPAQTRLEQRQETATTRLSAFGALRSSIALFQGSIGDLKQSSTFNSKQINLSDDTLFDATAVSTADTGSYSVEITALARAQSLASAEATAFSEIDAAIGSGTMTIRFGTTTTDPYGFTADSEQATQTITVSEANQNTTLSGLRDYINNNEFGTRATIVNDGNGFRLVLTAENTGASNSMEITVADDDGNHDDNAGLSQFAFNSGAQSSMTQTVVGQDASLVVNGLTITRDNNTVTGAIDGVTLDLRQAEVGNVVNLDVSSSTTDVSAAISEFIDGYNGLVNTIASLTSFDAENQRGGLLQGDFTVRNISNQLRSLITRQAPDLTGEIRSLADIGITTQNDGQLLLDEARLEEVLTSDPAAVEALFTSQGNASDADITFLSAGLNARAGRYPVVIDSVATRGVINGTAVNSLVIDANNDSFSLKVDGVSSGTINLTQASYADGDALAAHIQSSINADAQLQSAGVSVVVSYDAANNELDLFSSRYGSASTIEFVSVDTNTANDLGFDVGVGIDGLDVVGTINGLSATGSGRTLTSIAGASNGLSILIAGTATGNRGAVSYSTGMMSGLDELLSQFVDDEGYIDAREEGLNDELEEITADFDELNVRLTSLEDRLVQQFTALDILISQMNRTSEFLTEQLQNLPEANSISRNRS